MFLTVFAKMNYKLLEKTNFPCVSKNKIPTKPESIVDIPHPKITKIFPLRYFNIVLIVIFFFLQKMISQMCLFFISVVICLN